MTVFIAASHRRWWSYVILANAKIINSNFYIKYTSNTFRY